MSLYKTFFDHARDSLLEVEAGGCIRHANHEAARAFGYEDGALEGMPIEDLIPQRFATTHAKVRGDFSLAPEGRLMGGGRQLYARRKDGSEFPVEVMLSPIETPDGASSVLCIVRDVTARWRSDTQLQQAKALLQQVVDSSPNMVYVRDLEGRILLANQPLARFLGTTPQAMVGGASLAAAMSLISGPEGEDRDVIALARSVEREQVVASREGEERYLHVMKVPLVKAAGGVLVLGIITDITERTHDMSRQRMLEEQLSHSQKMQAIGLLAGGVAHDFNNLLTIINSCSEELLAQPGSPEDNPHRAAAAIREAGERAALLTRQLLLFGRKAQAERRLLDLNEVALRTGAMLRRVLGEHIAFSHRLDARAPSIVADAGQIEQVILNLALNARDAMPYGGDLSVETRRVQLDEERSRKVPGARPGTYAQLTVRDTGHGMSAEVQSRAFEPFFTTKGPGMGSGLGLAIVYGIVQDGGGFIHVSSAPGRGTAMDVYLPAADTAATGEPAQPREDLPTARGETVLLVEDDDSVRLVVLRTLEHLGYRVLEAPRGAAALALLDGDPGRIDMLLTDVVMPDISGVELAQLLNGRLPGLKVLFMSGYHEGELAGSALGQQHFGLLAKPFTPSVLARRVREVLD